MTSPRRSPRQSAANQLLNSKRLPGQTTPLQPSPLRNEITSNTKSRKRARSLGGHTTDDLPNKSQPRKKRMTIVSLTIYYLSLN
jgi:hypothetical protein